MLLRSQPCSYQRIQITGTVQPEAAVPEVGGTGSHVVLMALHRGAQLLLLWGARLISRSKDSFHTYTTAGHPGNNHHIVYAACDVKQGSGH